MGLFAGIAFLGLAASLFLPRRRVWLRVRPASGGSVVQVAALARGDDPGLQRELDRVVAAVAPDARRRSTTTTPATRAPRRTPTPRGAAAEREARDDG